MPTCHASPTRLYIHQRDVDVDVIVDVFYVFDGVIATAIVDDVGVIVVSLLM